MKAGIHPELKTTKVHCNGCGIEFETQSVVDAITVDICSNCHPFYTGKQKLVDTAGRVEKFEARRKAAAAAQASGAKRADTKAKKEAAAAELNDPELKEIAEELEEKTVETAAPAKPTDSNAKSE